MHLHAYSVQKTADEEFELNTRLDRLRDELLNDIPRYALTEIQVPYSKRVGYWFLIEQGNDNRLITSRLSINFV